MPGRHHASLGLLLCGALAASCTSSAAPPRPRPRPAPAQEPEPEPGPEPQEEAVAEPRAMDLEEEVGGYGAGPQGGDAAQVARAPDTPYTSADSIRETLEEDAPRGLGPAKLSTKQREELRRKTGFPAPAFQSRQGSNCSEYRGRVKPARSVKGVVSQLERGLSRVDARFAQALRLDSFRRPPPRFDEGRLVEGGAVAWEDVADAIEVTREGGVTYYRLVFTPRVVCTPHVLTMTSTGHASLMACCGK